MQYFKESELRCKCGCGICNFDEEFLQRLDKLRALYGAPILITSGARCPEYNKKIDGAESSYHISTLSRKARAVDIGIIDSNERYRLVRCAFFLGFTGIGVKSTMVHVDTREEPSAFWLYPAKKQA